MIKTFAKIENGIVTNIALAEDTWPFENDPHIEIPEGVQVGIGWSYDGTSFIAPSEPEVVIQTIPEATSATPLQFLEKFNDEEQLAIVTATMNTPIIKLWYDKLLASTQVVYSDPKVTLGIEALVAFGLITQVRSEAILPLDKRTSGMQSV
jgi:hypothetical protein